MVNKRISDGVGKKIVEALKKQSEIEISTKSEADDSQSDENSLDFSALDDNSQEQDLNVGEDTVSENEIPNFATSVEDFSTESSDEPTIGLSQDQQGVSPFEETSFSGQNSSRGFQNYAQPQQNISNFAEELDTFEIPNNIAILKRLITQLPKGVTRHTGAQIIKQTMEALGISMKSVLQEAQTVQDNLSNSAKECQSNIQEYKKQIITLEKQVQSNQRQYAALNELISLFIQTGV